MLASFPPCLYGGSGVPCYKDSDDESSSIELI